MRRIVGKDDDLTLSFQNKGSGIFSKFNFTCCEWLSSPGRLFRTPTFNITNLCALGTREGPILIVTKNQTNITPVCLLCGHRIRVTAIAMSHGDTVLSADADGNVAGWHLADCICKFFYKKVVPGGSVTICPMGMSKAWIWTRGVGAYLVDLESGAVTEKIQFFGLKSLSVTSENKIIMVGIGEICCYSIQDHKAVLTHRDPCDCDLSCIYECSSNWIIRYNENSFWIMGTNPILPLVSDVIKEIESDDSICRICWEDERSLCVASYGGVFAMYTLQLGETTQLLTKKVIKAADCFVRFPFAYSADRGIMVSTGSSVSCLSYEEKVLHLVMPPAPGPCDVIKYLDAAVLRAVSDTTFELCDWRREIREPILFDIRKPKPNIRTSLSVDFRTFAIGKDAIFDYEFGCKVKISCLSSTRLPEPENRLQILAGGTNGSLYFFWEGGGGPFAECHCLTVPIIGIAPVSVGANTRPYIIVIGQDGSCALVRSIKTVIHFETHGCTIKRVRYIESGKVFEIESADGLFCVYTTTSTTPMSRSTCPHENGVIIWEANMIEYGDGVSSTNILKINGTGMYFGTVKVAPLSDMARTSNIEEASKCIFELLAPISKARLKETDIEYFSCVLRGACSVPTFFYPMYRLTGQALFETSPYTAAMHFLSYSIVADVVKKDISSFIREGQSKIGEFISVLIQFMYVENKKVRNKASEMCVMTTGSLTYKQCQNEATNFQHYDKSELTDADKFLLAIIYVSHSQFVSEEYLQLLFEFLMKQCFVNEQCSSLAMVILLNKVNEWSEAGKVPAKKIYIHIIKAMYHHTHMQALEDVFLVVAGRDIDYFYAAVQDVINEGVINASKLLEMCTQIAFRNQLVGSIGTLAMAKLGKKCPHVADLTNREIAKHAMEFRNVAKAKKLLLIGLEDGTVYLWRKSKVLFSSKLFNGRIDAVSIGPDEKFVAVVSNNDQCMKKIKIVSGVFKSLSMSNVETMVFENVSKDYQIVWDGSEICYIR